MGHSTAMYVIKGINSALYPEKPPVFSEYGDIEKGGVALKKETGYGELRRVWRELSPAQIPHLFVATILAIQIIKAAANCSVVSCTLYSAGTFIVYRDLATGGLYVLAIRALKGQITQVDRLKSQVDRQEAEITNLETVTNLIKDAGGNVHKAVEDLKEQIKCNKAAAEKSRVAAEKSRVAAAESRAAAAESRATAERNKAATIKLEETERRIKAVTTHLEEVGTLQKPRHRSRSFSGSPTHLP